MAALAALGVMSVGLAGSPSGSAQDFGRSKLLIATEPGQSAVVAEAAAHLGAEVIAEMPNVDVLSADVPNSAIEELAALPQVISLAPDMAADVNFADPLATAAAASSATVADTVNADQAQAAGLDGRGIDVAIIDSGVAPVAGLAGKVVNGPDFSADGAYSNLAGQDGLGHGTHMAGIVAGRDSETGAKGIAPGARIVNVKVATYDGRTTVESVIQGLDWVVEQKKSKVYNIRVVNLSFGVDGITEYVGDPLSIAVESAWKAGIVVVVSAGNDGTAATSLGSPATDPYVIAVGASDTRSTPATNDDTVAPFSSLGTYERSPDVVAPGVGVVSLRVPGSVIDDSYPEARMSSTLFRGNGTSQAAAVVSGVAALMLQANPSLTPNEIKARLVKSAVRLGNADRRLQGSGSVDVVGALRLSGLAKSDIDQKHTKAGKDALKVLRKLQDGAKKGKTTQNVETDGSLDGNRWRGNRWRDDGWKGNRWRGDRWE
jgi:serine protease AprX